MTVREFRIREGAETKTVKAAAAVREVESAPLCRDRETPKSAELEKALGIMIGKKSRT